MYDTFRVPYAGSNNSTYAGGQGFCCGSGQPGAGTAGVGGSTGDNVEKMQYYYHPDHIGSTSFITNLDGEVAQYLEYIPFGETFMEKRLTNYSGTPYQFNGKELDAETNLYYYGARYYDPVKGIWISVDAMSNKFPQGSPYAYCSNNPIIFIDPDGNFKTKFGAQAYAFFHGGNVSRQVENGDKHSGEWRVSKTAEYKGEGGGVAAIAKYSWNNKAGDAIDATANWVNTTDFVLEGKAKISLGVQVGLSGAIGPLQGKIEGGAQVRDLYEAQYDITENEGHAGTSEQRMHNFFGAEAKLLSNKLRLGGKYDYTYLYYNGYNGPTMEDGTATHDWTVNMPFKNFGPKINVIGNAISTQLKVSTTAQSTNGATFYGLDLGAGVKFILGIDVKLKVGFKR